jgi:hypothetical protein
MILIVSLVSQILLQEHTDFIGLVTITLQDGAAKTDCLYCTGRIRAPV